MTNDAESHNIGSSPSRGTNFAKEIAVFSPFRVAQVLAVVSKVVPRRLKWRGRLAGPRCALASAPVPRKGCAKGIAERRAGVAVCHHVPKHSGRLTKACHSPRAALWQRVWRAVGNQAVALGGSPGLACSPGIRRLYK